MANGYMGPSYRRSAIWGEQEQRKAMGMQPMSPGATEAAVRGELEPYYAFQLEEREKERQAGFEERRLAISEEAQRTAEKAEKSKETGNIVSGVATGVSTAAAISQIPVGALSSATYAAEGVAAPTIGSEVVAGVGAAATSIWEYIPVALAFLGTVICTELYRQGILEQEVYLADAKYGDSLPEDVLIGYRIWAVPIAKKMGTSRLLTQIISLFAIPWAKEMAHRVGVLEKGNTIGKLVMFIGLPICKLIGQTVIYFYRRELKCLQTG